MTTINRLSGVSFSLILSGLLFSLSVQASQMAECHPPLGELITPNAQDLRSTAESVLWPEFKTQLQTESFLFRCLSLDMPKDWQKVHYLIEKAAQTLDVPFAVPACLFAKESEFHVDAINQSSGAMGIGQVTEIGLDGVKEALDGEAIFKAPYIATHLKAFQESKSLSLATKARLEWLSSFVDGAQFKVFLAGEKGSRTYRSTEVLLRKMREIYKMVDKDLTAARDGSALADQMRNNFTHLWLSELENTIRNDSVQRVFRRYYRNLEKEPPLLKHVQLADLKDPELAIAVSIANYELVQNSIRPETGWGSVSEIQKQVFTSGAYNTGARKFKCDFSQGFDACLKNLKEETQIHMRAVRSCLSSDPQKGQMPWAGHAWGC